MGKNARAWHQEPGEQVGKLLPVIDAALRCEPEKVAAAEARSYHDRA
ncbi:hypothetical protein [Streptomyces incanus]|uniref:Uncharacterized protein n=1 Tax=Streptomyces incanus TaxID=887453 RepID=A0ABW0XWY2_9ACTN